MTRAAIVSGAAPPEMPGRFRGMWLPIRALYLVARRAPWLSRIALKRMGAFYANKEQMRKQMVRVLPAPDVELMERRPEIIDIFAAAATEAHRDGSPCGPVTASRQPPYAGA